MLCLWRGGFVCCAFESRPPLDFGMAPLSHRGPSFISLPRIHFKLFFHKHFFLSDDGRKKAFSPFSSGIWIFPKHSSCMLWVQSPASISFRPMYASFCSWCRHATRSPATHGPLTDDNLKKFFMNAARLFLCGLRSRKKDSTRFFIPSDAFFSPSALMRAVFSSPSRSEG